VTEPAPNRWAAWDDPGDPPPPQQEPPRPEMPDLPTFVQWLTSTWRRPIDDGRVRTWCPRWWAHAEAIDVLEGLWRAWEQLRLPEHAAFGRATFWRDWAYPLLRELTAEDGPFARCSITTGHAPDPLPPLLLEEPEPGMFAPEDVG
jgi:hypothetical protein